MERSAIRGNKSRDRPRISLRSIRATWPGPHPEERALARVSKDGCESLRCVHPSRRLLRKLLRMRSRLRRSVIRRHTAHGIGGLRFANPPYEFFLNAISSTASTRLPDGQITQKSVKPLLQKYSDFPKSQISLYPSHPVPLGGAFRERHGRRDGLRWTRRRARRAMPMRTVKSCGPDISTLVSSRWKQFRR